MLAIKQARSLVVNLQAECLWRLKLSPCIYLPMLRLSHAEVGVNGDFTDVHRFCATRSSFSRYGNFLPSSTTFLRLETQMLWKKPLPFDDVGKKPRRYLSKDQKIKPKDNT